MNKIQKLPKLISFVNLYIQKLPQKIFEYKIVLFYLIKILNFRFKLKPKF